MKKILCFVCVLTLLITCFTGCGKKVVVNSDADISNPSGIAVDKVKSSKGTIDVSDISGLSLDGIIVIEDNVVKVVGGGEDFYEYELKGKSDVVKFVVDAPGSNVSFIVNDEVELSSMGALIDVVDALSFSLYVNGTAKFVDTQEYLTEDDRTPVIDVASSLSLGGNGTLDITSVSGKGIVSVGAVTIENQLSLNVTSMDNCISTSDTLLVTTKVINLKSEEGKGLSAKKDLTINSGTIVINSKDEGIESKGILSINDGIIDIFSGEDGLNAGTPDELEAEREKLQPQHSERPEGMGGKYDKLPEGEVPPMPEKRPEFNGGKKQGSAGGFRKMPELPDGVVPGMVPHRELSEADLKFFSEHCITITGGKISLTVDGDAIDSNGNLTISGGEIFINGPTAFDNSALDCDGAMNISGGKISCVFAGGMFQHPAEGSLKSIIYKFENGLKMGDKIELKDSTGKVIVTHLVGIEAPVFMYLGDEITDGSTYTISLNGKDELTQIAIDVNADLSRVDKIGVN